MQATNMGNTFFKTVVVDGEETKEYLNSELSSHSIWQTRQFWEDALMQGMYLLKMQMQSQRHAV